MCRVKLMLKPARLLLFVLISLSFLQATTKGRWIEQSTTDIGSGDYLYDCEGDLAIVTKENAKAILIFDTRNRIFGKRIEINKAISIDFVEANTDLAWAYVKKSIKVVLCRGRTGQKQAG